MYNSLINYLCNQESDVTYSSAKIWRGYESVATESNVW